MRRCREVWVVMAALLLAGPPAVTAEEQPPSKARQEELLDLAKRFALTASGDEKNARYYRTFQEAARRLKQANFPGDGGLRTAETAAIDPLSSPLVRLQVKQAQDADLHNDKTWQQNFEKWIARPTENPLRVFCGDIVADGALPHCVAIGDNLRFCCTGTLIGPNVVLTAAHCMELGCFDQSGRVYIGSDFRRPVPGKIVPFSKAIMHPDYDPATSENDLALIILDENTDTRPCRIATTQQVDEAYYLVVAGFGRTETSDGGRKMQVEVIVSSPTCSRRASAVHGCHESVEIVAGGNCYDSCNGDSGGPAYVEADGKLLLAGATSRAKQPYNPLQPCGSGGIYVRVDKYQDWIKEAAEDNGGTLAP